MKFRDFKKVDTTSTHTIFKHPNGHTIEVAHEGLDPAIRKQMREIPISPMEKLKEKRAPKKLAEGTEKPIAVATEEEPIPDFSQPLSMERPAAFLDQPAPYGLEQKEGGTYLTLGKPEEQPMAAQPEAKAPSYENFPIDQGAEQAKQEAPPMPEGQDKQLKALDVYEKGAATVAQAQQAKAAEEAQAITDLQQKAELRRTEIQNEMAKTNSEIEKLEKARAEGKIDPNRYMGNRSTVQKIFQTIGLILGGIGSGLTGQPNLAYKVLESNIERDIDQQKSQMETQNNLLAAYNKKLGNLQDAQNMVRLDYIAQVDGAAQLAAAKSGSKEAQGRYQMLKSELDMRRAAITDQIAQRRVDERIAQRTMQGQEPTLPEMGRLIQRYVPEKLKEDANKEMKAYVGLKAGLDSVGRTVDRIFEETRAAAKLGRPIESRTIVNALKVRLIPEIKKMTKEGKFTDQDFNMYIERNIPSILASKNAGQAIKEILLGGLKDQIIPETTTLQQYIPGFVPVVPPTATPLETLSKRRK